MTKSKFAEESKAFRERLDEIHYEEKIVKRRVKSHKKVNKYLAYK